MPRKYKLKGPPQPLLFRFGGECALCGALSALHGRCPGLPAALAKYQACYYLCVGGGLRARFCVIRAAAAFGQCLGAAPVLYAFFAEHGTELYQNLRPISSK